MDSDEDDIYSQNDLGSYSDEEEDGGYSCMDNDEFEGSSNPRQKNYTILSMEDIGQRQQEDITALSTLLSIPKDSARVLLLQYNWNSSNVHEAWFADEAKVRATVGLVEDVGMVQYLSAKKKVNCGICFENFARGKMFGAVCGHLYCRSCWEGYISTSIKDGAGCLTLRCPEPKCRAAVSQDIVNTLVCEKDRRKYSAYLLRSYVEDNLKLKWCPAPGCEYAVDYVCGSGSFDVSCNCASSFCWNCTQDAHSPVDCETVRKWIFKSTDESENVNWILAKTKACPKCKRPIEKNDGCMHMTCKSPCKFEFCWLCLATWTDYGHRCNVFDKEKVNQEDKKRAMAKNLLDKYAHYYERWAANQKSRQKAVTDLQHMQSVNLEVLLMKQCQTEGQLKFLTEAWQQIIECRRVLKWTYAYGYYLPEHEHAKKQLFEYLQGQAESWLERLHHCVEKDLKAYLYAESPSKDFNEFRTKLAGLTGVTRTYFQNLVQALENGLADVDRELWPCDRCTYYNEISETSCTMCNQDR